MTPEEARYLEIGLRISAARLRGDTRLEGRLLEAAVKKGEMPRLVEAFVYVALTATELMARAKDLPFQDALQGIEQQSDVVLLQDDDLGVGSWEEIVRLASAVKRSHDEARQTQHSMDIPSAINASFQLGISALIDLSKTSEFDHMSPAEVADVFIREIEAGHA